MNIQQQKQLLHSIGDTITHIESCDTLASIDPAYYGTKRAEYVKEYQQQVANLNAVVNPSGLIQEVCKGAYHEALLQEVPELDTMEQCDHDFMNIAGDAVCAKCGFVTAP